jgi:hypothetical protein
MLSQLVQESYPLKRLVCAWPIAMCCATSTIATNGLPEPAILIELSSPFSLLCLVPIEEFLSIISSNSCKKVLKSNPKANRNYHNDLVAGLIYVVKSSL